MKIGEVIDITRQEGVMDTPVGQLERFANEVERRTLERAAVACDVINALRKAA